MPKTANTAWARDEPGMSTFQTQRISLTKTCRMQERGGTGGELGDRDNDFADNLGDNSGRGSGGKKDSTMGRLMEKAGDMMNNENLQQKGAAKRDQAGRGDDY